MSKFNFVDPKVIMSVVVSLMILGIGVFAFFTVTTETGSQGYMPSGSECETYTEGSPLTFPHIITLPASANNVTGVTGTYVGGASVTFTYTYDNVAKTVTITGVE